MQSLAGDEPGAPHETAAALLARLREDHLRGDSRRTGLLIIDQLEELFEPAIAAESVVAFGELVEAIVTSGAVWVVATIRSDALGSIDRAPALASLARSDRVYRLDRPSRTELAEIVAAPAVLAGKSFPDRSVPEQFADIAAQSPDSLPLLQTVLYRFFEQADPQGRLTAEGLTRIGGFEGAVSRWAEDVRERLVRGGASEDLIERVLISLVRIDPETKVAMARSLAHDPSTPEGRLLRALADDRLVSLYAAAGGARARLAHEALITHWPRLRTLVERLGAAIAQRDELEQKAAGWIAAGEEPGELLRGAARLEAAQEFLAEALVPVAPDVARYVEISLVTAGEEKRQADRLVAAELDKALIERDAATQRARAARRLQQLMGAAAIVCAGVAGVAVHQYFRASQAEVVAAAEAETSRQQTRATRISQARLVATLATRMKEDDPERAQAMLLDVIPDDETDPQHPRVREAVDTLLAISQDDRARIILSRDVPATASAFAPDGSSVATVFQDGRLRIWSAETGAVLHSRFGHDASIIDVEFSRDGRYLITTAFDGSIQIRNTADGNTLHVPEPHDGPVYTGGFNRDATHALTVSDGTVRIWNMADGSLTREIGGADTHPVAAAFHPANGAQVLVAGKDGSVRLIDVTTGQELRSFDGHTDSVGTVEFSADGSTVATASRDRSIRVWDVASGTLLHSFTSGDQRYSHTFVRLSADGAMVAAGYPDSVARVWDVATGTLVSEHREHPAAVKNAAFSPDGQTLITVSYDRTVRVWSVGTKSSARELHGHTDTISTARFSLDGRFIATASVDGTARLWQVSSTASMAVMEGHSGNVYAARFDPSGARIVSASRDRTARIWDAASGKLVHTLEPHGAEVNGASFSGDGAQVLTYSNDGTARVWDAGTGALRHRLDHNGAWVRFAAFATPDGTRLVTVANDHLLRMWDTTTQEIVREVAFPTPRGGLGLWSIALGSNPSMIALAVDKTAWSTHLDRGKIDLVGHTDIIQSISYNADDTRILTASEDGTVRVWDAKSGDQLLVLSNHDGGAIGAAFSPDGALIASGANDGAIRIWDAATGTLLQTFNGHLGAVLFVVFSPDGTHLVSSGIDETVRTWRVGPKPYLEAMIDRERLAAFVTLSEEERRSLEANPQPDADAIDACDRLAAQPFDPGAPAGAGVVFDRIDIQPALAACEAAVAREPATLRFSYQLGRVLRQAGRDEEANIHLTKASEGGYAMASHALGLAYRDGEGVEQDEAKARVLFQQALDGSIAVSAEPLGDLLWFGRGGAEDRKGAVAVWNRGAAAGDPSSHNALGWVAEAGRDGSTPDLEAALLHYARSVRLANAGSESVLGIARARQATLARILDPEAVARVWAQVRGPDASTNGE